MFTAFQYCQMLGVLAISAAVEVPLYDSTQLDSLAWPTYSAVRSSDNRAWREASFTTADGQLMRVYTVCNVAVLNTDNWLYMPYIDRSNANRIYIQMKFSIRGCANYRDPTNLQQCKESFRLLYYDADGPVNITLWNEDQFTNVDVIAATTVFTDTSNPAYNTEVRSYTVTRSGFVFAFRDLGSCMTLLSVKIYYIACESFASFLASYPITASGPEPASIVSVPGVCVSYSEPYQNNMPTGLCTADGRWFTVTGGCTCQAGFQLNSTECSACPQSTYKPSVGDTGCVTCPANSMTSSVGSSHCSCIAGFQRATASNMTSPCYSQIGSVTNLSAANSYAGGVVLSWSPPSSGATSILYNVKCSTCGSNVLFLPRQSSLDTTSVMVRGLDASSVYTMTVYSETADGITGPGVDIVIQTAAVSSVPSKPLQCHVTAVGTRFISLAWQSPDGAIDMFQVSYWVNELANNISLVYSRQPNVTVYGLQPYTVYLFTVRGRTATGWTDYGEIISASTQYSDFAETQQLTSLSGEKNLIGIIVGSTVGILFCLVILALVALLYVRRSRKQRSLSSGSSCDMLKYISGQHASQVVGTAPRQSSIANESMSAMSDAGHVYADLSPYEDPGLLGRQSRREVDPACVTIERIAGSGHFGDIYFGRLTVPDHSPVFVTIDILPDTASEQTRLWFLATADLMRQFDDANVIYTEGIVTKSTPHMVLTEFTPHGTLLDFLRNGQSRLATSILLTMAQGVASGMKYLADRGYIHTDLAAESILVGERYVCKVASLDFCRKVGDRDFAQPQNFAVRWSAPEVLLGHEFTQAADVWSYGVLMWEILSFGKHPYSAMTNQEVKRAVCDGTVLSAPSATCPDDIYRLMLTCWKLDLRQRPTFANVLKTLQQFLRLQTVTFSNSFLNNSAFV